MHFLVYSVVSSAQTTAAGGVEIELRLKPSLAGERKREEPDFRSRREKEMPKALRWTSSSKTTMLTPTQSLLRKK